MGEWELQISCRQIIEGGLWRSEIILESCPSLLGRLLILSEISENPDLYSGSLDRIIKLSRSI